MKNAVAAPYTTAIASSSQNASAPVTESAASTARTTARTVSADSITRRRSKRSLTAPPISRHAIVGIVIAIPTVASAVGASDSVYTCHASATRNTPSPSSDTDMPPASSR